MLDAATALDPRVADQFLNQEDTEPILAKPKELAVQCVVNVGDVLTLKQKKSPLNRLGGRLFPYPDFYTVKNGIVSQCQITRLRRVAYRSIHKGHIKEEDRDNWVQSYVLRNQWDPSKGEFVDIEVGTSGASEALIFKPIKAIQELGRIAGVQNGVVALDEECGINDANDIREAQMHYFPDWVEIVAGTKSQIERIRDLEEHIRNRREMTNSSTLRAIGDAFLISCSDFYDWGKAYVDFQTSIIKETEKVPGGARYDEVGERLFRVLGLSRQDQLVENLSRGQENAASSTDKIADTMRMIAESNAQMQNIMATMAGIKAENIAAPVEPVAPAPTNTVEAEAQIARDIEDDHFSVMEAVEIQEDAEIDGLLAEAGIADGDEIVETPVAAAEAE